MQPRWCNTALMAFIDWPIDEAKRCSYLTGVGNSECPRLYNAVPKLPKVEPTAVGSFYRFVSVRDGFVGIIVHYHSHCRTTLVLGFVQFSSDFLMNSRLQLWYHSVIGKCEDSIQRLVV